MTLHYRIITRAIYFYLKLFRRLEIQGNENVPETGAVIFAPNHISWLDPCVLAASTSRQMGFFAKKELFIFPFNIFFHAVGAFPVDRMGNATRAIRTAIKLLGQGLSLAIFPEGTRNLSEDPLLPAKRGVGLIARKADRPIIPVAITGSRGYTAKIRIRFGQPIMPGQSKNLVNDVMSSIESMLLDQS